MARTHDPAIFQFALIELAPIMRADIFDCENVAIAVTQQHFRAIDHYALRGARWYFRPLCYGGFVHSRRR